MTWKRSGQRRPHVRVPLLILNSAHDPATALEWAVNVNRMIRRSVLVTYEGAGHGVYLRTDWTTRTTDRCISDQVLPVPGTRCPGLRSGVGRLRRPAELPRLGAR